LSDKKNKNDLKYHKGTTHLIIGVGFYNYKDVGATHISYKFKSDNSD